MTVNANRKYSREEPPTRVTLTLPDSLMRQIDAARGDVSRNAFIKRACEQALLAASEESHGS